MMGGSISKQRAPESGGQESLAKQTSNTVFVESNPRLNGGLC